MNAPPSTFPQPYSKWCTRDPGYFSVGDQFHSPQSHSILGLEACKLHIPRAAHQLVSASSANGKHWCESGSQEELKSLNVLSCALALAALVSQHSWTGVVIGQSQQHPAVGGTSHAGTVAVARQQALKCLQSSKEIDGSRSSSCSSRAIRGRLEGPGNTNSRCDPLARGAAVTY